MARNSGWIEQDGPINVKLYAPSKHAGDVVALNDLVVYAQTNSDANGYITATLPCAHVQKVAVKGEDHSGDVAVSAGDKLYLDGTTINKDATDGKPFGYALEAIASGVTANIEVGFGL